MRITELGSLKKSAGLGLAVLLTVAACGTTASPSGAPAASQTGAPAASQTSGGSEAPAASQAAGSMCGDTCLQDYAAQVEVARKGFPQTWSGPTEPAKAPSGIKFAGIGSAAACSGCWAPVVGMQHAAEALGWQFQSYDGQGDPAKQNAAFLQAIAWGANIIGASAIDPNQVQQGMQAAKDKGVLIVSGSSALSEPNTYTYTPGMVEFAYDIAPDYAQLGRDGAAWIANDSGGKGVVAVYGDWEFPSVIAHIDPLYAELQKAGLKTYGIIKFTVNQIATSLGPDVVGFLKSHPDVNYIVSPHDPGAEAMVTAIMQAGLQDQVQIVSIVGSQHNIDFIRQGQVQAVDEAYDNEYMGWAMIDQSIRLLNKQELFKPIGENMPYILLDKTNLPAPGSNWVTTLFDYKAEFMKLWK